MTSTKEQQRRVRDYRARRTVHERSQRRLTRDNVIAVAAVVVVGTLAGLGQWWYASSQPTDDAATASESPAPSDEATATEAVPDPSLAEDRMWTGSMTIDGVELGIQLDGEAAPQAVSAVINDIQTGYYPGKTCHRLTTAERFEVLQCGSIDGTGAGDPDYQYGPIENAPADDVYPAGTIAMARAGGDANSNGHQFFIVYGDTDIPADAAGGYTVIGQVTSGLDQLVTDVIAKGTKPDEATGVAPQDGEPLEPVTIDAISVQ